MSLLEQVREAGIVGAGGAGFPTHVKLATKAEYILLNGAECEPLLRVDQQLMAIFPEEIIQGLVKAGRQIEAKQAIIGIKGKHKEVVTILRRSIEKLQLENDVMVTELNDVYPAGDEQVLVYELTGRVVPEGGIPIQVGCVVVNSETALNIYRASQNLPVTETYITIAGDVPNRLTLKVPLGTPVKEVLRLSGIENFEDYAVINGGPMMGPVMTTLEDFVTKKSKGFILLNKYHHTVRRKSMSADQSRRVNRATCEQCRLCTDLCPRYLLGHDLEPHKMMRVVGYQMKASEDQQMAYLCCQCNVCELFACPIGLFPRAANQQNKLALMAENIRFQPMDKSFVPRAIRESRLLPSKRLIARLGLSDFDKPAPFVDVEVQPDMVYIARSQHVGAPAIPIVAVGDRVEVGKVIGTIPENSLGANIHASVAGTVEDISDKYIVVRRG